MTIEVFILWPLLLDKVFTVFMSTENVTNLICSMVERANPVAILYLSGVVVERACNRKLGIGLVNLLKMDSCAWAIMFLNLLKFRTTVS